MDFAHLVEPALTAPVDLVTLVVFGDPSRDAQFKAFDSALKGGMFANGTLAATGCWDDIVRIFRVPSGELVTQLEGHGEDVMCVAFHPSGKELASGGRDRTAIAPPPRPFVETSNAWKPTR